MSFTKFKGFDNFGESTLEQRLKANLITFFDWGFLNIGAYSNINIPTSGLYGGDRHILRPANDPRYTNGQVWEGHRSNWAWESGVNQSVQPIQVSGVYVDGTFHPLSSNEFFVDYPNGRIIFSSAQSTSSTITVEHTQKYVYVGDSTYVPFFREFQLNSFRADNPHFFQPASGEYSRAPETRLQLPAVVLEATRTEYAPYSLGTGASYAYTDFIIHVFAEDDNTASKIADIISYQKEKKIFMFDIDKLAQDNRYPLDINGSIASGALVYPQLVEPVENGGFRWRYLIFKDADTRSGRWLNKHLFHKTVRMTTEVVLTDL